MILYKVVGKERKTGEYNGTHYDNTYLYCIEVPDCQSDSLHGQKVATIKASSKYLDIDSIMIGEMYNIYFTRFGQFDSIFSAE